MKTIELSTGTLLVVDGTFYERAGVDIPDGFNFLGHPSEITGEVWDTIVDEPLFDLHYVDYTIDENDGVERYAGKYTLTGMPLESGLSLCAAHNIQESDVLLFKAINKQP